ncbi:MAG: exodeoxyribonuclease VII large subunit [Clostridia bacterium]|nr:exodeoxyribonuclease VII large subunit [Clostridia bacterium]
MSESRNIISVTALNEYVKRGLEGSRYLSSLLVAGEISNLSVKGGHLYFSLKDKGGAVSAIMFRSYAERMKFVPENGMQVVAASSATLYVPTGRYQLNVTALEPYGKGALYAAFEQLTEKLRSEGLFDQSHKKPLPPYPETIGVITSPSGAAVRDIVSVTGRRFPSAVVKIYPALVQGDGAEESLVSGIRYFSENRPDVIIIGRGGGSIEDLWAFNGEKLARAVFACPVPVISAVGHETDFTICDYAADVRAATPSAAAELAVPDSSTLLPGLSEMRRRLVSAAVSIISDGRGAVASLAGSRQLTSPGSYLADRRQDVIELSERLNASAGSATAECRRKLSVLSGLLGAHSPLGTLSKGYAAVFAPDGSPVSSALDAEPGQNVRLVFADGEANAEIKDRNIRKEFENAND